MGAGDFRGDAGRLGAQIEEVASVVYGMPKNDHSKRTAEETAGLLITLSRIRFDLEEEAIPPRPPAGGKGSRADG